MVAATKKLGMAELLPYKGSNRYYHTSTRDMLRRRKGDLVSNHGVLLCRMQRRAFRRRRAQLKNERVVFS